MSGWSRSSWATPASRARRSIRRSRRSGLRRCGSAFPDRQRLLPVVALGLPAAINSRPATSEFQPDSARTPNLRFLLFKDAHRAPEFLIYHRRDHRDLAFRHLPRALPGCDDSLPYGLSSRPDIRSSLFRNGKPHIWTLQGHFWTVMSSHGANPPKNRATDETERRSYRASGVDKKEGPRARHPHRRTRNRRTARIRRSRSDKFNGVLINAMAQTGWFPPGQTDEACNQQMFAAVAALAGVPADR